MIKIKINELVKIALLLVNILLAIFIIEKFQILGFCYTIMTLISPIFFGYGLAWLLKPVMFFFKGYFKEKLAILITYLLGVLILFSIGYFLIPIIITEVRSLIPQVVDMYSSLSPGIKDNIDFKVISTKIISSLNKYTINVKDIVLNIFYSVFISYFLLLNHRKISSFLSKRTCSVLINNISANLKAFVRGTVIKTIVLFILAFISFRIVGLPYAFLFGFVISVFDIIPFIGPYIGGAPAVIVAFNVSVKLGVTVLVIVIMIQIIESAFINPYIMSRSVRIDPIFIILSLIIFGYFFGVIGMILSVPIITVIKTLYEYNKEFKVINLKVLGK